MKLNFWIEPSLSIGFLTPSVKPDADQGKNGYVISRLTSLGKMDRYWADLGRGRRGEGTAFQEELAILLWRVLLADSLQIQHLWDLFQLSSQDQGHPERPPANDWGQWGLRAVNVVGAPHWLDQDFVRAALAPEAPLSNLASSHIFHKT